MPNFDDLSDQVSAFINTYKILSPEAKAAFEAQLDKSISTSSEESKMLYQVLRQAAKDGLTAEEAIEKMSRSVGRSLPTGPKAG
ncbi:MAG TPA: hypothetical protein VMD02_05990 [Candidatus Omnitrophota bacterium]|nr:hypothetical protein [Candidatus Omnitrophota bacterium]